MNQRLATKVTYLNYHTSQRKLRSPCQHAPSGDPKSETKEIRRENVCCGGTKTMELDPTRKPYRNINHDRDMND